MSGPIICRPMPGAPAHVIARIPLSFAARAPGAAEVGVTHRNDDLGTLLDHLEGGGRRQVEIRLRVDVDDLDLAAVDTAGRVDVVRRDIHAVVDRGLERREHARQAVRGPDHDRVRSAVVVRSLVIPAANRQHGEAGDDEQHQQAIHGFLRDEEESRDLDRSGHRRGHANSRPAVTPWRAGRAGSRAS